MLLKQIYTLRHVRTLLLFSLLSTSLLFLIEIVSWSLFRNHLLWLESLGAVSFAWNDEWMSYTRQYYPDVPIVFHTSLLLVFLLMPLMIRMLAGKVTDARRTVMQPSLSSKWLTIGIVLVAAAALNAYWIKVLWLPQVLFVFDFVLSMGIGIGVGLLFRGKRAQSPFGLSIGEAGKWSLYGFIIVMMITASHEVWHHGNPIITVADKHGEADDVILIVPPVILWMINYPHYWIFAWLYRN